MFTRNVCFFKNTTVKIRENAKADVTCECNIREKSASQIRPDKNGDGYGKSLGNTVAFVSMYQPKFGNDVSLVRQGFMLQIDIGAIH